jgi:hypothetical protein
MVAYIVDMEIYEKIYDISGESTCSSIENELKITELKGWKNRSTVTIGHAAPDQAEYLKL